MLPENYKESKMHESMPSDTKEDIEEAGRGTDSVIAHMSLGEIVIPRAFQDDPQVMEMLQALFEMHGANINQYTVGHKDNSINPETGYPEFGFGKFFKKALSFAAPLALSYFAPGLGSAIGGSLLGAGAAGSSTLGNALLGGAVGGLTGGSRGALTGAIGGGFGANIGSLGGSEIQGPNQTGSAGLGTSQGSGILGEISKATGVTSKDIPSIGGLVGGSGGGSTYSNAGIAANIFNALNQDSTIKRQQKAMLGAQGRQLANIESFDPSQIVNDPGYKFNLEQGQIGLDRALNASGDRFSGRALRAASEYNQNYASNAFKNYFDRWKQRVDAQNAIYGTGGDVRANALGASSQNLAQTLSNILGTRVGQYGGSQDSELLRRLMGAA